MRRTAETILLAVALLANAPASAQAAEETRATLESLRPTGPVTLTADSAEWIEGGEMQYLGNVTLRSDTLTLRGDRMTVTQPDEGQFQAQVVGSPAQLDHAGTPGAQGAAAQAVSARATRIDYDSRAGVVRLSGNARLQRGSDEVSGEQIEYIVSERRVRAAGGTGSQVRIVIQPPARSPRTDTGTGSAP